MSVLEDRAARRTVLKAGLGLGLQICLCPGASAQTKPANARPKTGDLLVRTSDESATPLTPADIKPGKQILVWAMDPEDQTVRKGSRLNQVLLVRLDPAAMTEETRQRSAEGILAYTAICTHTGCEVTDWVADEQALFCPCHASKFDAKDDGKVTDGPAPRSLPALPLKVVDGKLTVAGSFTSRVGFEEA